MLANIYLDDKYNKTTFDIKRNGGDCTPVVIYLSQDTEIYLVHKPIYLHFQTSS